jgi:hypothetical protein
MTEPTTATYSPVTVRTTHRATQTFVGALLGSGTSRRDGHLHPPDRPPAPGVRCSGCRWTETKIFWSADDRQYVISMIGRSVLPGETDRVKTVWTASAEGVLDTLLIKPPRNVGGDPDRLELPQPNADALEEASERDPALDEVFARWDAEEG